MLDHTGYFAQHTCQGGRIGDLPKVTIEDVITFISDEWFSCSVLPQLHCGTQSRDFLTNDCLRESDHLDRQGTIAKYCNLLGGISNNDFLSAGRSDDLLA